MPYRKYTPVPRDGACGEVDKAREALAREILDNWKHDVQAERKLQSLIEFEILLFVLGGMIVTLWYLLR